MRVRGIAVRHWMTMWLLRDNGYIIHIYIASANFRVLSRSFGFDNLDLPAAASVGISPEYLEIQWPFTILMTGSHVGRARAHAILWRLHCV